MKTAKIYNQTIDRVVADTTSGILRSRARASRPKNLSQFAKYEHDPVTLCKRFFHERYTKDIEQMMYSVWENPVTIAQTANAVGKSHGSARVALAAFLLFPKIQVYLAAAPPESNLRNIVWAELMSLVHRHQALFPKDLYDISDSRMRIERRGSSLDFIQGLTIPLAGTPKEREAKFSGKHRDYLLFIVDEADAVPEECFRGMTSCMSGGSWARLLAMFNPRRAVGTLYDMIRDGQANVVKASAFSHPNVVSGSNIIPGAVTRETTVRRINEWTVKLSKTEVPDSECFKVPDFLEGCVAEKYKKGEFYEPLEGGWRRVVNPSFSYMVLAEFPASAVEQLIPQSLIDRAVRNYQKFVKDKGQVWLNGIRPVSGLDVQESPTSPDNTVLTLRYGNFVSPQEVWKGLDPIQSGFKAADSMLLVSGRYCNVDATGVGAGAVPAMKMRGVRAHRVMVQSGVKDDYLSQEMRDVGQFERLRDQMLWLVREYLRLQDDACIPDDPELIEELAAPDWEKNPKNGKIKVSSTDDIKLKIGRSPDKLMSLALSFVPVEYNTDEGGGSFNYLLQNRSDRSPSSR